ncbi:MAG: bifunctional riboflavin kinase/FAD synthetase [Clostridiales bacterium]|jgi:riboflavin kinase/FMN adenylyltransferase|nr:bifunctional riboflavin kinase/FAD synthetase [Clostridiales bacterium]
MLVLHTDTDVFCGKESAVAIGNFDGLHIGHMRLINELTDCARKASLQSVIFTFNPHPRAALVSETAPHNLAPGTEFSLILTPPEREFILSGAGIDVLLEYNFAALADLTPEDFVRDVLAARLRCREVFVGCEHRFGRGKTGDSALLKALGRKYGFNVHVVPNLTADGVKVSSSAIRRLVAERRFEDARRLLGRPYFVMGRVEHGRQMGRKLGFPTVNILPPPAKLLPPNGVYLTATAVKGQMYQSLTNIGFSPTFENAGHKLESHLVNFSGNVYGETVTIYFLKWLRDEVKFNSSDELAAQLRDDLSRVLYDGAVIATVRATGE